jgi:uncharacterized protein YndB with AHSA1/START domain
VTRIDKNHEALTMTLEAEFDSPVERVWQVWADPRQLERWWGPPAYPATVVEHDLAPGGVVTYFMTGPTGDRHDGWWRVVSVDAPHGLSFQDGFGPHPEEANHALPGSSTRVTLAERAGGGTTMTIAATFPSKEAMRQLLELGMEQGLREAVGQIDGLLP